MNGKPADKRGTILDAMLRDQLAAMLRPVGYDSARLPPTERYLAEKLARRCRIELVPPTRRLPQRAPDLSKSVGG